MRTNFSPPLPLLAAFALMGFQATAQVPEPVVIQGVAETAGGEPLTGSRAWRVRFYSDASGTTQLGPDLTGTTALSDRGRFSFALVPPTSALAATDLHYAIAVDGNTPPNGIDSGDEFPGLVRVGSVPFARRAESALSASTAATATTATNSTQLGGVAASEYARASVRTYSVTVDDDGPADFSTIQAAIASGAKSIFVRNGTYSINSIVDIPAAPFSLIGESMHGVVLNFGDNGCLRYVGDTGLPYREGTINVSSNSTTVTAATGAPAWLSNAAAGEFIRIGLTYHEIASVNSESQLTLRQRYNGPSRSGVSYGIARYGTGFHFEGFTARDPRRASSTGAQDATFGAICLRFARDITIRGCRVEKNTGSTFSSAGGLAYLENCHNVLVTGNSARDSGLVATMNSALVTISDNDVSGADVAAMGAIAVSGSANDEPLFGTIITGNRVYNSRGGMERCAIFYGPLSETGIPLRGSFVIADNVVQDCFGASPVVDQSAGIMIFNPSAGTGTIANNVVRAIAGNGITFVGSNFSGIAITGNVLTGNSGFGIAGTSSSGHEWRLITNNMMEGNSLGGVGVIGTAYGTLNVPSYEVPVP